MTHSPADVIRWLLVALGLGSDPTAVPLGDWPVYASAEPGMPDRVITVYDTQGTSDGRTMPDGESAGHDGIQVRVRAADHASGWIKADAVARAFAFPDGGVYMNNVTVEGSNYLVLNMAKIGNVLAIGKDTPTSKRSLFTLNAVAAMRQLS